MRGIVLLASLLGAIGVGIGAYAAHGLEASMHEQGLMPEQIADRLRQCEVAVRYQMVHTLALLILGLLPPPHSAWRWLSSLFFTLGIALFSGGLYSMVFAGVMGHWAIVPSGGLCFILGWSSLAGLAWREST